LAGASVEVGAFLNALPATAARQDNLMKRKILVILSNRLNLTEKPRHLELDCDEEGNILVEKKLRSLPRTAKYDEVWENDEGKLSFTSCNRFKRRYRHALEKKK
jgi:hypothetical protein